MEAFWQARLQPQDRIRRGFSNGCFIPSIIALCTSAVGRQLPEATVLDGEQLRICSLFALFQMSSLIFATFSITECSSPACMSPQQCSQCQRIMPFAGYTQSLKDKLRIDSRRQGWSALTKITNVTAE